MKIHLIKAFLLFIMATSINAAPNNTDFEPAKTWVFAVTITEWQDSGIKPLSAKDRKDEALIATLKDRGVAEDHVICLKDGEATKSKILSSITEFLKKAGSEDTLIFYYQGHGGRRANGDGYFLPYDCKSGDAESGLMAKEVLDLVESSFGGNRAMFFLDCCYSGTFFEKLKGIKTRTQYAVLSSSLSSAPSTGAWTFTETVMNAFKGHPWLDLNNDGSISLGELAKYANEEMVFSEDQMTAYHTNNDFRSLMKLASSEKKANGRIGQRVEAKDPNDQWFKARIEGVEGDKFKVHYINFDRKWDETLSSIRIRPVTYKHFGTAELVEVEKEGQWRPAKILKAEMGLHYIQFEGESDVWNEWVSPKRIRLRK